MKLDWRLLKNITFAVAVFLSVMTTAHSQPFALLTLSNAIPTNLPVPPIPVPQKIEFGANQTVPLIEMYDMPISTGIEHLARQAEINYLVDTRLAKWWSMLNSGGYATREPTLNFRWKNLTAKEALLRVLGEHHLVLAEDPVTSIARITYTNQVVNPVNFSSLGKDTLLIPLIQFEDVPITTGLENLARQAGINYLLDPKIGYGWPDKNGQVKVEPLLSVLWENVTAKQGFVAVCENYDLLIVKDLATSILLLRAKDHPLTNFADVSLLGSDTNSATPLTNGLIPLVQLQDAPLDAALKKLIEYMHINVVLDPKVSDYIDPAGNKSHNAPTVTIRWENITARQAIVALCENYNLVIAKDAATGVISIKPRD